MLPTVFCYGYPGEKTGPQSKLGRQLLCHLVVVVEVEADLGLPPANLDHAPRQSFSD